MKGLGRGCRAFSVGIAAILFVGCGGSPVPPAVPAVASQSGHASRHAEHIKVSMLPEASSETLLYYTDGNSTVYVLSYPGRKLVGTLTGFDGALGVCSDASGNVFITTYYTEAVYEYAHGGTQQIAKLGDYGYSPLGCAVDPVTGNLAVANSEAMNGNPGNVAIYTAAKGTPTDYAAPGIYSYDWCAFDSAGNLYVNGSGLTEMPYGSQTLNAISLGVSGKGIRWDGQYLAMVDPSTKQVYRIAVSGSSGTVVDTVDLTGLFPLLGNDFVLTGANIIIPYGGANRGRLSRIGLFKYPKGGKLQKVVHRVDFLYDLTLSD